MTLIDVDSYRRISHDTTTDDVDVESALGDVQRYIEEELRRPLESEERTETLLIVNGPTSSRSRVYPSATPITEVPSGYAINGDAVLISDSVLTFGDMPGPTIVDLAEPAEISLTYTGGYESLTLPVTLQRAIVEAAYSVLHVSPLATVANGATSIQVGDVQVGYGADGAPSTETLLSRTTWRRIRRFQRRFV